MSPVQIVWMILATIAVVCMARLMSKRQAELVQLLKGYVREQRDWSRKRSNKLRVARREAKSSHEAMHANQSAPGPPD